MLYRFQMILKQHPILCVIIIAMIILLCISISTNNTNTITAITNPSCVQTNTSLQAQDFTNVISMTDMSSQEYLKTFISTTYEEKIVHCYLTVVSYKDNVIIGRMLQKNENGEFDYIYDEFDDLYYRVIEVRKTNSIDFSNYYGPAILEVYGTVYMKSVNDARTRVILLLTPIQVNGIVGMIY